MQTAAPTIDIHGHYVPRALMARALEASVAGTSAVQTGDDEFHFVFPGGHSTRALPPRLIDLDARSDWMAEQSLDIQVLSTWADLFGYELEPAAGADWSRLLNTTMLEAITGNPRFRALASLPMQSTADAIEIMGQSMAEGFVGVTVGAHVGSFELDDQRFDEFWQAASDLGAAVLIHPAYGQDDPRTADYGLINAVGRGTDTTIAAARLLCAGIPGRYPGARIILSHGGGTLPYLMGRLTRNFEINPELHDPNDGFKRLLFDSVVFETGALRFLLGRAAAGAVLLGSDYPFPIGDPSPTQLIADADLTKDERAAILGGSATDVLGLDK